MEAANTAAGAVEKAQEVEQAAREAETARITQDTELGIQESRIRAQAEIAEAERAHRERTQAEKTSAEIKELIAAAETALRGGDTATAVATGRKAAVKLLDSSGTWTREAAEFALADTDESVLNWIDADRVLAQRQDDREAVLAVGKASRASVADAAHKALASEDPGAPAAFLTGGAIEAAKTDYRVTVLGILGQNPGPAVKAKAEAALDDGSATAMNRFLTIELAEAVKEDDRVEILRLLESGGPYMKSAARIVLEGAAAMRRHFVVRDKYEIARLDQDHAAHVAAIRAAIAHAARIAAQAQEDAALASKAAAEARQAAAEASEWAAKAKGYATDAANAAQEAKANADAADKSAAEAAASAAGAKQAASVARSAARSANYSMRQAMASAEKAVAHAADAQLSASQAKASAEAAGEDADAAAEAASQAQEVATQRREAEQEAEARQAALDALEAEQNGTNPSQVPEQDMPWYMDWTLNPDGSPDYEASATLSNRTSAILGWAGLIAGAAALFIPGGALVLGAVALGFGIASLVSQSAGTYFTGKEHGFDSAEFKSALGMTAVNGLFFGKGQVMSKVGTAAAGFVYDAGSSLISALTWE
ncbi:hypothetical protein [Streptomyces sp. N502]|uniref:hypothetical protein n=1 Tax=Streptomyces sp. N502 TaxID=2730916 RepID=UPI00148983C1